MKWRSHIACAIIKPKQPESVALALGGYNVGDW